MILQDVKEQWLAMGWFTLLIGEVDLIVNDRVIFLNGKAKLSHTL